MGKIKFTGFWKEFYSNNSLLSIFDSINDISSIEDKNKILLYLDSCYFLFGTRGMRRCPVTGEMIMLHDVYTDGKWVWASELAHYLLFNDIVIDRDFLTHIRENNYKRANVTEANLNAISREIREYIK